MLSRKKMGFIVLLLFSSTHIFLQAKERQKKTRKKHECHSILKFAAGFAAGALTLHTLQAKVGYTKTDVIKFCLYKQLTNLYRKITQ